ncbi:MAG TPA: hypothetical protein VF221_12260, partial [Chloroflexota bacterium]
ENAAAFPYQRIGLLRDTEPPTGTYWDFYANFRCRHLGLHLVSNEKGATVRRVATAILHQETCGK